MEQAVLPNRSIPTSVGIGYLTFNNDSRSVKTDATKRVIAPNLLHTEI